VRKVRLLLLAEVLTEVVARVVDVRHGLDARARAQENALTAVHDAAVSSLVVLLAPDGERAVQHVDARIPASFRHKCETPRSSRRSGFRLPAGRPS
jgi:hypothetical protein